jgi:hypothetical protein
MKNRVWMFALTVAFAGALLQGCNEKTNSSADITAQAAPAETPASAKPAGINPNAPKTNVPEGAKVQSELGGPFKGFKVYTDGNSPDNHYVPSGWMGDFGDLKDDDKFLTNPHGGTTSVKVTYTGKGSQGARWAGIYWQNPPNNWGTRPGGYDLTGAKKLTFWARGDKGGERIEEFKMGGITGEYADSDVAGIGPVVLTTEWQQYTIDLEGKDLSSISGGFCWAANLDGNPQGVTFYLDDIRYE